MLAPAPFAFDPVRAGTPFVRRWLLLGPLEKDAGAAVTPAFLDEAAVWARAGEPAGRQVWVERRVAARTVDLRSELGTGEFSTAYAFTYLHVSADTDAVLWLGADNMARMLLDGRVVLDDRLRDRNFDSTSVVAVHLKAGVHRLLVRVENTGGWHGLNLRISDAAGAPLRGVVTSCAPENARVAQAAAANPTNFTPAELVSLLPLDPDLRIGFDGASDLLRLATTEGDDDCPRWRESGGPDYGPSPGRRGAMLLHPASGDVPQRAYWKVQVPKEPSALRLVVSAEAFAAPGDADATLVTHVFLDGELRKLLSLVVRSLDVPSSEGWTELTVTLPPETCGREALVALEVAAGGERAWSYEGVWFDEIAVVPAK